MRSAAVPERWREAEAAVVGLGRSGQAACRLLAAHGFRVYASDQDGRAALQEAARSLTGARCAVEVGRHDLSRIARAALVVLSPGVPPTAPAAVAARRGGSDVLSELELGARFLTGTRLIVVTGTKGKSTTAALVARLLDALELGPAQAAGNIGNPISAVALAGDTPRYLAVEASSFQLHDSPGLVPAVGVLTNLSADHLDRYPDIESYYADKRLLFRNATPQSRWVLNGDDEAVSALASGAPGVHERFSLALRLAEAWYDRSAGWLILRGTPLLRRGDLMLLGDHNVANSLAAALAVPLEADRDVIAGALRAFRALPHRLEPVREVDGVLWINDTKSTTVSSTLSALRAMERPVVLLLGGKDKGGSFRDLASALGGARAVIAYGEAGERARRELDGLAHVVGGGSDFGAVLETARALARPGDVVLLAPACASFDMFDSAEQRGESFTRWVEALKTEGSPRDG